MLSLAVCLMATVSSVSPTMPAPSAPAPGGPAAWASTYDEAACGLSDSGECAPLDFELALDIEYGPAAPADLDCKGPRVVGDLPRFGSCDLPRPVSPRARLAWLRGNGHGPHRAFSAASRSSSPVTTPPRLDDSHTLLVSIPTALVIPSTFPIHVIVPAPPKAAPRDRLERPPRV
jgi:hypothetical protein